MRTICKFIKNEKFDVHGSNRVYSSTCGKVTVVNYDWQQAHLNDIPRLYGKFWEVDIIKEIYPGTNRGCFICNPIRALEKDPIRLSPGFFELSHCNGILIVIPKQMSWKKLVSEDTQDTTSNDKTDWILPVNLRKGWREKYKEIYAIIVASEPKNTTEGLIDFIDCSDLEITKKRFEDVDKAMAEGKHITDIGKKIFRTPLVTSNNTNF